MAEGGLLMSGSIQDESPRKIASLSDALWEQLHHQMGVEVGLRDKIALQAWIAEYLGKVAERTKLKTRPEGWGDIRLMEHNETVQKVLDVLAKGDV